MGKKQNTQNCNDKKQGSTQNCDNKQTKNCD
jgi:hypothetical protein